MKIYTKAGALAFSTFKFPDGQPHFRLETYEREFDDCTIETALRSTDDLFTVALAVDVLRRAGYPVVNLDIRYLFGARMDRVVDWAQPFTLDVVAGFLNRLGLGRVRILDAHSGVALKLIRNSFNVLPVRAARSVWETLGRPVIVIPDKGAKERVRTIFPDSFGVQCSKVRNTQTGALSRFEVPNIHGNDCLIVDDICDGGATFTGLAAELHHKNAGKISLFVTHGLFSRGVGCLCAAGIDKVFTTSSLGDQNAFGATVIPVDMKELV